mmetsp:Transcript_74906/g.229207  ORF Transcript_74906/g.229207 Transcript_74906/m.229207 type:complete len:229 (-) Transcript_74906:2157-2843(-)
MIATPVTPTGKPAGRPAKSSIVARRRAEDARRTTAARATRRCGKWLSRAIAATTKRLGASLRKSSSIAMQARPTGRRPGPRARRSTVATRCTRPATPTTARWASPKAGAPGSSTGAAPTRNLAAARPAGPSTSIAPPASQIGRRAGTTRRRRIAATAAGRSASRSIATTASSLPAPGGPCPSGRTAATPRRWGARRRRRSPRRCPSIATPGGRIGSKAGRRRRRPTAA